MSPDRILPLKILLIDARNQLVWLILVAGIGLFKAFHEFQVAIAALGRGQSQGHSSPCAVVQLDPHGGVL